MKYYKVKLKLVTINTRTKDLRRVYKTWLSSKMFRTLSLHYNIVKI